MSLMRSFLATTPSISIYQRQRRDIHRLRYDKSLRVQQLWVGAVPLVGAGADCVFVSMKWKKSPASSRKKVRNSMRKHRIGAWQSIQKKAFTGLCKPNGLRLNEEKSITASSSRFLKERR